MSEPNVKIIKETIEASLDYDGHLSRFLGASLAACQFDSYVFQFADRLTEGEYKGGTWDMVKITMSRNVGGDNWESVPCFYLHLAGYDPEDEWKLTWANNWLDITVKHETFCVIVSLFALNHLCHTGGAREQHVDLYYALRDYASTLPEASLIYQAID